jgi:hypothetical protein
LEEIRPQPLADELGHEAELYQFDLAVDPPVQLGKASWDAIGHQDVDASFASRRRNFRVLLRHHGRDPSADANHHAWRIDILDAQVAGLAQT